MSPLTLFGVVAVTLMMIFLFPGGSLPLVDSGIFRIVPRYFHLWIPSRYLAFWRGRVCLVPAGIAQMVSALCPEDVIWSYAVRFLEAFVRTIHAERLSAEKTLNPGSRHAPFRPQIGEERPESCDG